MSTAGTCQGPWLVRTHVGLVNAPGDLLLSPDDSACPPSLLRQRTSSVQVLHMSASAMYIQLAHRHVSTRFLCCTE